MSSRYLYPAAHVAVRGSPSSSISSTSIAEDPAANGKAILAWMSRGGRKNMGPAGQYALAATRTKTRVDDGSFPILPTKETTTVVAATTITTTAATTTTASAPAPSSLSPQLPPLSRTTNQERHNLHHRKRQQDDGSFPTLQTVESDNRSDSDSSSSTMSAPRYYRAPVQPKPKSGNGKQSMIMSYHNQIQQQIQRNLQKDQRNDPKATFLPSSTTTPAENRQHEEEERREPPSTAHEDRHDEAFGMTNSGVPQFKRHDTTAPSTGEEFKPVNHLAMTSTTARMATATTSSKQYSSYNGGISLIMDCQTAKIVPNVIMVHAQEEQGFHEFLQFSIFASSRRQLAADKATTTTTTTTTTSATIPLTSSE